VIGVRYNSAGLVTDMRRIVTTARNPRQILLVGGRRGAQLIRQNFLRKDRTESNRLGGRREHFWRQLANSVSAPVVEKPTEVTVEVTDPRAAQKVFGGEIRAKRVKNLAIPQTAEAYGRSPATFERETGLKLVFIRTRGGGILGTRRSELSKFLQIEYVLTPRVKQDADPTALPAEAFLEREVVGAMQTALDRQLANS
jgi:hypothetical protein